MTVRVLAFFEVPTGEKPTTTNTLLAFCRGAKCAMSRPHKRSKRCGDCVVPHPDETVEAVVQRIARGDA